MAKSYTFQGVMDQYDDLDYSPKYINAYRVTLGYGGPEEGGWWYSDYEPLASVKLGSKKEAMDMFDIFQRIYECFIDEPGRSSVISDGDLCIRIEDEFATHKPQNKPHYC